MIKKLIDSIKSKEGYAGMAIYQKNELLFCDGLEPGLANKIKALYEGPGATFHVNCMTAIIRGFSVAVFRPDGFLVICRLEGRFAPVPGASPGEPEFFTGQAAHMITREEARKEAEVMLKSLISID